MFNSVFHLSILSLMLYGGLGSLGLSGVSTGKILLGLLPWIAFLLSLYYYLRNYRRIKNRVRPFPFALFNLLLITNLVNVGRSFFDAESTITTALGNPYNALALLTPFAFGFGTNPRLLAAINLQFRFFVRIGAPLAILFFAVGYRQNLWFDIATSLVNTAIFLIPLLHYVDVRDRAWILAGNGFSFIYSGIIVGSRATLIRYFLFYLLAFASANINSTLGKSLKYLGLGIALLPVVLLAMSISLGQSVFDLGKEELRALAGQFQHSVLEKADTRTFLYTEVYDDLISTNALIFGKGGSGTYFSNYFMVTLEDNSTRLTVEVGVLALMLKGGLFAAVLNYAIFMAAIYYSLAHSDNHYVMAMGFFLAVHVLLLFAENVPAYNLYNFTTWFIVGLCLSTEIRRMTDPELKDLLTSKVIFDGRA